MSLGASSGTPSSFLNGLKELISTVHALELGISDHTTRFVILSISFHFFKYLLGLDLRIIDLLLVLLLVIRFLSDHCFELLLDLEQIRHLQHKAHSSIVTQTVVHAHYRVLVHVLLYSTRLIDLFLAVFFVNILYLIPHIGFQGSHIVMWRKILYSYCEILSLNHGFSDFLIGFKLHCAQILEEEKHKEGSRDICYHDHKSDNLFLKVYLIHQKQVDIA